MRYLLSLLLLCASLNTGAQFVFRNISLSEALIQLDESSKRYDISFVYNDLEEFTVTKTISRFRSLPDAVRDVCGFYPVKVSVRGRDILVECIQKERTKLSGRLIDESHQPIVYANIAIYSDTTLIAGGVSNEAGDFVIPCPATQARVRISCVGFKTINRVMPIRNIGTVKMQMDNYYLENVTASGHMPLIRHENTRIVYHVNRDEMARGLNAQELLSRVPTVSVLGWQASILGKGVARFMINGHVITLDEESVRQKLWAIRSEDIERIEVVSVPSGRYQEDAGGGFINIVLRRDPTLGWRSDLSTRLVKNGDWGGRANASLGYASEKFDMTISADGGRAKDKRNTYTNFEGLDKEESMENKTANYDIVASAIFHYQPISNLDLGATISYRGEWQYQDLKSVLYQWEHNIQSQTDERGEPFFGYYTVNFEPTRPTNVPSFTTYADWTLDSLGKKLSFTYNFYKKSENVQTSFWEPNNTYDPTYHPIEMNLWSSSKNAYTVHSTKLDLTLPLTPLTLETGLSYTNIKIADKLRHGTVKYYQPDDTDYDYREQTLAAYCTLHKSWNSRLQTTVGLRYERTWLKGREDLYGGQSISAMTWGETNNRAYNHFLPALRLSYRLTDHQQIDAAWGMGIQRPNFNSLNPIQMPETGNTVVAGNPALRPSQSSNIELSYTHNQGLHLVAYHQHGRNQIEWLRYREDKVEIIQTQNSYKSDKTGLQLRYQRQLEPWLTLMGEGDIHYYTARPQGEYEMIDGWLKSSPIGINAWGKRLAAETNILLYRPYSLLFDARYEHFLSLPSGLTKYEDYGGFRFGLRGTLLDNRLKLSLVVNDPFRQHKVNATCRYATFHEDIFYNYHAQALTLTASYSLTGKRVRRTQHDTHSVDMRRSQKTVR